MNTFYFFSNKDKRNNKYNGKNSSWKKILIIIFMISSILFTNIYQVHAQLPVIDTAQTTDTIWKKIKDMLKTAGSKAYHVTLSSVLNKLAYDAATYVGSGDWGQKPLFITTSFEDYALKMADETAGTFLESFVNNMAIPEGKSCVEKKTKCLQKCDDSYQKKVNLDNLGNALLENEKCVEKCETDFASCDKNAAAAAKAKAGSSKNSSTLGGNNFNVCQPSSLDAKLKISLGLAQQRRPDAPKCTASTMINNWGNSIEDKYKYFESGEYAKNLSQYFDPESNDLGIFAAVNSDLQTTVAEKKKTEFDKTLASGGWLDARNWAGKKENIPESSKTTVEEAKALKIATYSQTTQDILLDALNLFINQTGMTAFNKAMKELAKLSNKNSSGSDNLVLNPQADPNVNIGESSVRERTMKILEVSSTANREIDILVELVSCLKPDNPSPNSCVIDDGFMQAIIERKTVAKAIEDGQLSAKWKIEKDVAPSAYKEHFSLRNVKILRKHRILPIGWEIAIERAFADPAKPRQATLGDLVSCFDPKDSFESFSDTFDVTDTLWCEGLVDPNWLLKAPLSYCGQKGSGSYIYEMAYSQASEAYGIGENLTIFRSDDYCADNQTCIKENRDGGCDAFGYCVEENRTWKFEDKSCLPINNTCQSFVNSSTGVSTSYLENTIDYGQCNVDSAGCRRYSVSGNYTNTGLVEWNFSKNFYFNQNLVSCNEASDGCSELIRVKPTWGANLIIDSNFSNISPEEEFSNGNKIASLEVVSSGQGAIVKVISEDEDVLDINTEGTIKATGLVNVGIKSTPETFPKDLQVLKKQDYILSAEVLLLSGDRLEAKLIPGDSQAVKVVNKSRAWQNISVSTNSVTGLSSPSFSFIAYSQTQGEEISFYIKNIKLELSNITTKYEEYGSRKINQKLIPDYLKETCYTDPYSASKNYSLKSSAPSICYNYARQCNYDEVGCSLFKKKDDNFSVPAKVFSSDYCPGDCLGYDVYVSRENYFNSTEADNLIPSKAKTCSQEFVGCNEFTNLDKVAQGGESKEYYSRLKQCIKPNASKCSQFYVWETSNSGIEIKTYNLQKDAQGNPLTTFKNQADGDCSDTYNLPVADPRYNPDCSEFRNDSGAISYRIVSSLITCSDNCLDYRLSEKNIDSTIKTASECSGADKHWNSTSSVCYSCLNGGLWSDEQSACIYKAIPDEGKKCSAANLSCREYNGSQGNNVKTVASFNFDNSLDGWYSDYLNSGISLAPISNSQTGKSLHYEAGNKKVAKLELGSKIEKDSSYTLRFLARSSKANSLNIYFINEDSGDYYYFNAVDDVSVKSQVSVVGGDGWNIYNINLNNLPSDLGDRGTLNILATEDFYLDNLILTKVNNRHFLLKNSIKIPDSCYYDNLGQYQGADYNLGCYQYQDQNNLTHNLHNFSDICSNTSIGCEQMISTNNYNSPRAGIWEDDNKNGVCDEEEKNCVRVERDEAIYAIYDKSKTCLAEDLGCSRMGEGLGYGNQVTWSDVFKLNNPNNYDKTLCYENDLGCEEYRDTQGTLSYFRNPANNVCEYRNSNDATAKGKFWFKAPVKRCDINKNNKIDGALEKNGPVCNADKDCLTGACIKDDNDYYCPVSYLKTIGYGGINNYVPVPDGPVGLCSEKEASCTEYIDPVSSFNPNLVKNSSFDEEGKYWKNDKWQGAEINNNQQVINFSRNKLYSFKKINSDSKALNKGTSTAFINFINPVRILQDDNNFSDPIKRIDLNNASSGPYIIFNSLENYSALLTGGEDKNQIEIKEVSVSYSLNKETKGDCSGVVNYNDGCILFNERSINGASGLKVNSYNAFATADSKNPVTNFGPYTANELLKVTPDRNCATWLSCTSYTIEKDRKLCTSMAECNLLDDKNECANYITSTAGETKSSEPGQNFPFDVERDKNASGYSIPNRYNFNNVKEVGLNTRARYNFEENIPTLSCLTSEADGTPNKQNTQCSFDVNIAIDSLVRSPFNSPVQYPAEGMTYLKIPASKAISPQATGSYIVLPEKGDYYISYLVNTEKSNTKAVVTIVDQGDYKVIARFLSDSPTGWKREVKKFTVSRETNIRIYLSSIKTNSSTAVYFDDVNIETVLEVGLEVGIDKNKNGIYVARDCRLFPTSSSFSCKEVDNTIVRNGVEGYCLEYDLANPSVCQLWMPIQKISSARVTSSQLGYDGKFPLNYCAEVDSNFMFLEKRVASVVREVESTWHTGDKPTKTCYYPQETLGFCKTTFAETTYYAEGDSASTATGETNWIQHFDQNNPASSTITGTQVVSVTQPANTISFKGTVEELTNNNVVNKYCGDSGNYFLFVSSDLLRERNRNNKFDFLETYICIPINKTGYYSQRPTSTQRYVPSMSEPLLPQAAFSNITANTDGWYLADGFLSVDRIVESSGDGGTYNGSGLNELTNDDSPLRVLDLNYPSPTNEYDLKKISSSDPDEVFRLTCNKFVETVSSNGDNMAWTERVNQGSNYAIEPAYGITYNGYVRKLGDIPFGAASWPKGFNLMNSQRVPLSNQYSQKEGEVISAGRPYGCDAGDHFKYVNCTRIGYCSANPDVYCLLDSGLIADSTNNSYKKKLSTPTYDIARQSCGSWGTCQPLWNLPNYNVTNNPLKGEGGYDTPLKQIFLQAPTAYKFNQENGGYNSVAGYYKSGNNVSTKPVVNSVKLYSSVSEITTRAVLQPGTYRLDFYTLVDAQSQPLREIFIDWGDGNNQVITGQDARNEGSGFPHSFYHYYSSSRNGTDIRVKIYDNWGNSSTEVVINR